MREFAKLDTVERVEIIRNAAVAKSMAPAIVEKDFWICWTLDYLFARSGYASSLSFKGGTSLSKGFGLIQRMSEDIDLIMDWRLLGYSAEEPLEPRSNTKQDAFIAKINDDAAAFLAEELRPAFSDYAKENAGEGSPIFVKNDDPLTICFRYPQAFADAAILQEIRLESGALAAWTPIVRTDIQPYVSEVYPDLIAEPFVNVRAVKPARTFWEKITILHKEAHRATGRFPARYSRHYYDTHQLCNTDVKAQALGDLPLLEKVVGFTSRFYRANFARYDLLKPGTTKLIPPDEVVPIIEADYRVTQNMLFGAKPTFDEVMATVKALEDEINSLV
jgi:hypothetical protein